MKEKVRVAAMFTCMVMLASCAGCVSVPKWSEELGPVGNGNCSGIVVADFNGDTFMDIAAGNEEQQAIEIWLGNGAGQWYRQTGPERVGRIRSLAAGDFNGDGLCDIVATSREDVRGVRVYLNRGNGLWEESRPAPAQTGDYGGIAVADINHDGNLDIVATLEESGEFEEGSGGVYAWLGNGRGGFAARMAIQTTGLFRDVCVVDLNGDGDLDVVATAWGIPGGVYVWLGDGKGSWAPAKSPYRSGNFWGIATGDFNRDGTADLCIGGYRSGLYVAYGKVDDVRLDWKDKKKIASSGSYWGISIADFNGDGFPDIVAAPFDKRGVYLWLNAKDGNWQKVKWSKESKLFRYYSIATADFNDDGRPDIAAANYGRGVHVWMQLNDQGRIEISPRKVRPAAFTGQSMEERKQTAQSDDQTDDREADQKIEENAVYTTVAGYPEYKIGPLDELLIRIYTGAISKAKKHVTEEEEKAKAIKRQAVGEVYTTREGYPEYIIGPKDLLEITIYTGVQKMDVEVYVHGDGTVFLPQISEQRFKVAGLSTTEVEEKIIELMKSFFRRPNVQVRVKKYESKKATILGEIRTKYGVPSGPGVYPLTGKETIVDFISAHGGPTDRADLTRVQIVGRDGSSHFVNVARALFEADQSQNVVLKDGDVILVPSVKSLQQQEFKVKVTGGGTIYMPMIMDSPILVDGMTPSQISEKLISIMKDLGVSSKPYVEVEVTKYVSKKATAFGEFQDTMEPETGPGTYPLRGKETVVDFIAHHGGPTSKADISKVQVIHPDGKVSFVNLFKAVTQASQEENVIVDDNDVVYIPSFQLSRRKVFVIGEVMSPGIIEVQKSMTVLEAIFRAGGYTRDAVTKRVYVVRGSVTRPEILTINLDRLIHKGDASQNIVLQDDDIVYVPRMLIARAADALDRIRPFLSFISQFRDTVEDLNAMGVDTGIHIRNPITTRVRTTP